MQDLPDQANVDEREVERIDRRSDAEERQENVSEEDVKKAEQQQTG